MNKQVTSLSSNYITCGMVGRLGNQMFQIANAYAQSLRHNRQLALPSCDTSVSDYFESIHRKLDFSIMQSPSPSEGVHTINATYHYTEYKPHENMPTVFRGYFESEKYFKDYSEVIKQLFGPTATFINKALKDYPQLNTGTNAVINVRRGDFLVFPTRHPVVTKDYLYKAIEMLPVVDTLFVVSDDIEWCKQNLKHPNIVFVEYIRHEALWFLSLCQNFVISNSTFSWWGAYLSRVNKKIVIAPSTWFGPDIKEDTRDIVCDGWLKVPTKWEDGFIVLA